MRFLDAGESHGKALVAIIEGLPSGLKIDPNFIDAELRRRQCGHGRGGRMEIETDRAEILSGVRGGLTLGSPVALLIPNLDHGSWHGIMGADADRTGERVVSAVRPGHADLPGCIKYGFDDARNVLERASARETATRVAVGAVAKQLLSALGVEIGSHVVALGGIRTAPAVYSAAELIERADNSEVRCMDRAAEAAMIARIDEAKAAGDTLGGVVEAVASGVPAGVGSYVHYDRRLDFALMGAVGSIQSVKAVAIGLGEDAADRPGSEVHDEIALENGKFRRRTNNAGGIEGGMSNGEDIVLRAYLKPIPTVMKGMNTVDIRSGKPARSAPERSDVCAVPAAGVVIESVMAFTLASAIVDGSGSDKLGDILLSVEKARLANGL